MSEKDHTLIKKTDIFRELDVDVKLKLTLEDLRIFSRYLEGELRLQLEDYVLRENELGERVTGRSYKKIKFIIEILANGIYKGMVDTEKLIIDELKEKGTSKEELMYILAEDVYDRERVLNIYEAMDELKEEEEEAKKIFDKLDIYGKVILSKIKDQARDLYIPLIFKFYWFLHNSVDKTGEIVFTENSIEELLSLDREGIEDFLDNVSGIEVSIGNKKERLVDYYSFLNETTIKIEYSIATVNPMKCWEIDDGFEIGKIEDIEVKLL